MKTIFYSIILVLISAISFQTSNAQVTIVNSTGVDGTYSTLKAAFDAMNANPTQTGNSIIITITASTIETASAVLNASDWSSVGIYPIGSGYSISGSVDGAPLIDLNGADNVTIDGRVNAIGSAKDLTISNTSTSNLAGTSTFRFIADATNNVVQYCTVRGSETNTSSGVVFFSTAGAGGNDNNTITNCNLTHAGVDANRPINLIFSSGSASNLNSGITISNNYIYDFLKHGTASNGIKIETSANYGGDLWTISDNSFYETASFTASAAVTFRILNILSGKHIITGNYIGGSADSCGGSSWLKTGNNTIFQAIYIACTIGAGNETTISGNTIANFNWTNSSNAVWRGMHLESGKVFVGTSGNPNIVGSSSNPITVTTGATGGVVSAIYINAATVDVFFNTINYLTVANSGGNKSHSLYGIYKNNSSGAVVIDNCTISNLTANTSTASGQVLYGVYSKGTTTVSIKDNIIRDLINGCTDPSGQTQGIKVDDGSNTITGNSVYNLSCAAVSTAMDNTLSVGGIVVFYTTAGTSKSQTISNNTIYNLSNSSASTAMTGLVAGIFAAPNAGSHTINANFIHSLSVDVNTTDSKIAGIYIATGGGNATTISNSNYSNNIISLGGNTSTTVYGIYETGAQYNNVNIYYNTVFISGSLGLGKSNKSFCLNSNTNSNTRDFRNNLFYNARSTIGGSSLHYSAYYNYADNSNLTNNFNDYFISGTGGVLGYFNSVDKTDVNITGTESGSLNLNPSFANAGGASALDYLPGNNLLNFGTTLSVASDYINTTRINKTLGAIEIVSPRVEIWIGGSKIADYTTLKGAFAKINDGTHTGDIIIKITGDVIESASAVLNASGSGAANYTNITMYPTTVCRISGVIAGAPLVDLNGADHVVIDGRINQSGASKDLTLTNTSTSSSANTSTIRFIADATNNLVSYCNIKGSETNALSGVIYFSTAASGNTNDTIRSCSLTNDGGNRPINMIYSEGTLSHPNSFVIASNLFYDFLNTGTISAAINLGNNTTNCSISGNSFYQTSSFVSTASVAHSIIRIEAPLGDGFEISENYFGGNAASATGTWTKTNAFNNDFYCIYMNVANGIQSNIMSNIIKGFAYSNATNASWYGIIINGGNVAVGATNQGNVIGVSTGNGSIVLTNTITAGVSGSFRGISFSTTNSVICENNTIAAITVANTTSTAATHFYGIYKDLSGDISIRKNFIGSDATSNSILASSASTSNAQHVVAIYSNGSGNTTIDSNTVKNVSNAVSGTSGSQTAGIQTVAGNNIISNNIIQSVSSASGQTGTGLNASAYGICQKSNGVSTIQKISANTVKNIINTHASNRIDLYGIFNNSNSDTDNEVLGNFIHGFSISSSAINSDFDGIVLNGGKVLCANNIISLGSDITNGYRIYGIFHTAGDVKINFNSIALSGTVISANCYNSIPLYSGTNTLRDIQNNILINNRSGGTPVGTEGYRIIRLQDANIATLSIDYNDYYTSSGANFRINNSNYADLTSFKGANGQDAHSNNVDPQFISNSSSNWRDYYPLSELQGISILSVTVDYHNIVRELPIMGALEGEVWEGFTSDDFGTGSNWISGRVPVAGKSIRFAKNPYHHCVLDVNRIVKNIYNDQSVYDLVINEKKLTIQGNLYFNNGAQIDAKAIDSEVEFNGDTAQFIPDGAFIDNLIEKLTVNNTANITLDGNLIVNHTLNFTQGLINTGSNILTMSETGNTVNGACFNRYINGKCSKEGNNPFTFPIGKSGEYAPIGISAPGDVADVFTAEYFKIQPIDKENHEATINHISDCEFWELSRDNGISSVQVTLSWDTRSCGVTSLTDLLVAHYIGGQWKDEGNSSTTGTTASGSITSIPVSSFSPFTLASKNKQNPLPISLIDFTVNCSFLGDSICWSTASETNSAYFEIQHSQDAIEWEAIAQIKASGNSNQMNRYTYQHAPKGFFYYRLKIVDGDGSYDFSGITYKDCESNFDDKTISVSPNPFNDKITINLPKSHKKCTFEIENTLGRKVYFGYAESNTIDLFLGELNSGIYFLKIKGQTSAIKIVKN